MLPVGVPWSTLHLLVPVVESGFLLGGIGMYVASRRVAPAERKARKLKFFSYFIITHAMLLCAFSGVAAFFPLLVVLLAAGFGELIAAARHRRRMFRSTVAAFVVYGVSAAGALYYVLHTAPARIAYLYLIVCVLDAYSQIVGQFIGRHPLAPAISPAKTVEGAVGGTVAAMIAALICRELAGYSPLYSILWGGMAAGVGILADLAASKYKRLCSIRDYSMLLPGQGGVVDRFNSFFAVTGLSGWLAIVF